MRKGAILCKIHIWPFRIGGAHALNRLFFGDNLEVLRESIEDETVDLVYLDPPFNSSANYNVLFSSPKGHQSGAQIEAFEDTWHWGEQAEKEFNEILSQPNTQIAEVVRALRQFLGENDMMAYLVMMANRLLELYRVLKPSGSLYLHCDPTASHYLKIILDGIFGPECFQNEIVWQRTSAHNDPSRYGRVHDIILFYSRSDDHCWIPQYEAPDEGFYKAHDFEIDEEGRRYRKRDLTAPGHGSASGQYEWNGKFPPQGRMWSYTKENMEKLESEGRIVYTKTGMPRLKIYVENLKGVSLQDVWANPGLWLNSAAKERLGYPTQKPLSLLERIVSVSSKEGDVILDPFCGCGTAVHAAQKLNRKWIGIDITHLAISLIEKRLRDAFPGIEFEVHGTPKDFDGARDLAERDKYQFQWWACSLVNAQPYGGKKKGADGGVDGLIFFQDDVGVPKKIIVSVKGGENVGITMVKDLIATIARQKAEIGLFVSLNPPTKPMISEAAAAGFYQSATGAVFPKIQILQIEKLIDGSEAARYPNLDAGALTFKKAAIEQGEDKQVDLFAEPIKAKKLKK
jgi:adenine specific DNA methylase Mod